MPLARRARRVPGLAPRGGSRIRTGGDAIAALVLGALAVSICSSLIAALHDSLGANYEALGLVYLPAVIGEAFLFGLRAGVLTAIAASAVFDAVLLPPDGIKTPDSRVWLLFAALLLSGAAVAELAARERRRSEQAYEREREAALLAGLSSALVGGASLELAQVDAARVAAAAIGAPAARIVLGRGPLAGQVALPLDVDGRVIGRLELMGADPAPCWRTRSPSAWRARWRACWRSRRSASGSPMPTSRPRRCARPTRSRRRCCAPSRTSCARRSRPSRRPWARCGATRCSSARRPCASCSRTSASRPTASTGSSPTCSTSRGSRPARRRPRSTGARSTISCAARWPLRARARPGTHIEIEAEDELPLVRCDASQIERVLVNLIENAAKFSPPDEPVVLRARASDDDHVEIAVLDHGPGIELDQRERVFEPFYRGRGGGAGGTGLGLAIARGFVEANAGTLTIDDAPGGGTCMRIVLPAMKVSEEVRA